MQDFLTTLAKLRVDGIIKVKQIIEENKMSIYIKAQDTEFYRMGKIEGEAEGEPRGKLETLKETICKLYLKKQTKVETLAELLDLELAFVQAVIN